MRPGGPQERRPNSRHQAWRRRRVQTSRASAASCEAATARTRAGTDVEYKAPAMAPPATAAPPWTAANIPYAVARRQDGTRWATRALTVESCTPTADPHTTTPATATAGRLENASTGTAVTSAGNA